MAYDVDNIEECVSGFEKFVDQIMIFFTDTFKDWANASNIQYLILNIVRSGFQIKILLSCKELQMNVESQSLA